VNDVRERVARAVELDAGFCAKDARHAADAACAVFRELLSDAFESEDPEGRIVALLASLAPQREGSE